MTFSPSLCCSEAACGSIQVTMVANGQPGNGQMSPNGKRDFYFRIYSFICYVLKNQFAVIFVEISVLIRLYVCTASAGQEDSHWSVISSSVLSLVSAKCCRYLDKHITINSTSRGIIKNWKGFILAI